MINKNNLLLIALEIIKNIFFSTTAFFTVKFIINILKENNNFNILLIIALFFVPSIIYIIIARLKVNINLLTSASLLTLIFLYLITNIFITAIVISGYFALTLCLIDKLFKFNNNLGKFIFNGLLFFLASEFVLLLLFVKMNYSIDEGFLLLFLVLYLIYSFFIYTSLCVTALIWKLNNKNSLNLSNNLRYFLSLLGLSLLFIFIFSISYWHSLDLFEKPLNSADINKNNIYYEITEWSDNNNFKFTHTNLTKKDLINYLQQINDERIDRIGCLYLLTGEAEFGEKFKNLLLSEAKDNKFFNENGSVKAWQIEVSGRVYFYLKIKEHDPNLFNKNENQIIINWFKNISEHAYKITLADYSYAYLFKQKPMGFYYNQEIGFGMLALLFSALKEDYPELAQKNKNILDKYAVGWSKNFRNTDDGIVYHQDIWIKNTYLLYQYASIGDLKNAELSFDWILYQSPYQSGVHPNYNSFSKNSSLGSVIIGYSLLNNNEYKYLAENFLLGDIKNKAYSNSYIGFDLWNDNITARQPEIKSYFIKGPTGLDIKPKKLKPDKLALRKIINGKELFILINLRSSGWHRYNGSGSVIIVKYGDDTLFKNNLDNKNHDWLPKGKSQHRDKKITNYELDFYQPFSGGLELLFYYLFSFDDTLKYKNYDKFISEFEISKNNVNIKLDDNNRLIIELKNNNLLIYYNNYNNTKVNVLLN